MKNSPALTEVDMETATIIRRLREDAESATAEAKRLRARGRFKEAGWHIKWARTWLLLADKIFAEAVLPAPIPARNGAAFAKAAGANS
jgi:hypothetical protein